MNKISQAIEFSHQLLYRTDEARVPRSSEAAEIKSPLAENQCYHHGCKTPTTLFNYYCQLHNPVYTGLEIKTSTYLNAGDGLFASQEFEKEDTIDIYGGELSVDEPELGSDRTYVFHCSVDIPSCPSYYIDAKPTTSCMARWVNSEDVDESKRNSQYQVMQFSENTALVALVATRKINIGEEIICYYGPLHKVGQTKTTESEPATAIATATT